MTVSYKSISFFSLLFLCLFSQSLLAHADGHPIADEIDRHQKTFENLENRSFLTTRSNQNPWTYGVQDELDQAAFFNLNDLEIAKLRMQSPELIKTEIVTTDGQVFDLRLYKANIFTDDFQLTMASSPDRPVQDLQTGMHYWGIVEGQATSLVALSFSEHEIMGFVQLENARYSLGRLENDSEGTHVFYLDNDLKITPPVNCEVDETEHYIGNDSPKGDVYIEKDANNCVRMYIEVDHSIYLDKGGQTVNYITGAFSQVAIMYANEFINVTLNELFVWDVPDPYTGPSSGNFLTQFRNQLNGNFNGDLAHLLGYGGGGGVAYLDVLCGNTFRVAYSGIGSSYNNVPTYSWTVMVITHEIGHNLGSPHTHSCAWNGNNTAVDGCGFQAGAGGCNGPIPPQGGTIMSYCHLIGGVGINFNEGFGQQPGDLIRNEVYNASCLTSCSVSILADAGVEEVINPIGAVCDNPITPEVILKNFGSNDLTDVTINYAIDGINQGSFTWSGSLSPNATTSIDLPAISLSAGAQVFTAFTSSPNGGSDSDGVNDSASASFTFSDADNDGVCDDLDQCPGGDDNFDANGNGIPDDCDCANNTANFPINPLTHSGLGSSSTTYNFAPNSSNIFFNVTDLNAKLFGRPGDRFRDQVTVSYVNGSGINLTYGVFDGGQQSQFSVSISGFVQSVTVSLEDGYDGLSPEVLSVNLGPIIYCNNTGGGCPDDDNDGNCNDNDICPGFDDNLIGTSCDDGDPCTVNDVYTINCNCAGTYVDSDADGVCDANDVCPGGDDNVDSDGNGIPDDCDNNGGCNNPSTSNFSPNPLTHSGTGSSNAFVSLPGGAANISFTIFNIDARLSGRPNLRYNESVLVTYVDGAGNTQTYGTFDGNGPSSVDVNIAGAVQSITLSLSDIYDGNANNLSVDMTAVDACLDGAALINPNSTNQVTISDFRLFPNPSQDYALLSIPTPADKVRVVVRDLLGQEIAVYNMDGLAILRLPVKEWTASNQVYLVSLYLDKDQPITKRLIVTQ